jgi:integrase
MHFYYNNILRKENACQSPLCLITSTYQTQNGSQKMQHKINDYELADAISAKWPKGRTPIFPVITYKNGKEPLGIDFTESPYCINDETEEDYGLKADSIINESVPTNTRRAYLGDILYIRQWTVCANVSWPMLEEDILKFIIHHLQGMPAIVEHALLSNGWKRSRGLHSFATVKRRLVSLSILHKFNKLEDPCNSSKVKALLSAMAKTAESPKKSKAITKNILENMLATCKDSAIDIRDKALLLFGWCSGGRRRSEISDATFENLNELADGDFIYHISRSKTDQTGKGHDVPVKGVAAAALRYWLKISGINDGKLFRSVSKGGKIGEKITEVDINRIVKKRAEMAGYDSKQYSAHSLRRGFMTEGGKQGCPLGDMMALSGHKSVPIAMGYYESGAVIMNKAADLLVSK